MARVASVIKEPGVFSQSRQGDALSTARAAGAAGNTAAARSLSRHVSAVVAVTLLVCAAADAATAANGYGPVLRGRTSFYGGSFDKMNPNNPSYGTLFGNCGQGLLSKTQWPYWQVGAVAVAGAAYQTGPTHGCGACWSITCSAANLPGVCLPDGGTATIVITDNCPECESLNNVDFDIQALTFASLANASFGIMAIEYQQVPCRPPGNMIAHVTDNMGPGAWARFGIEVKTTGLNNWVVASNKWGAIWEVDSLPGPGPYTLHVILADGQGVLCPQAFSAGAVGRVKMQCQAVIGAISGDRQITQLKVRAQVAVSAAKHAATLAAAAAKRAATMAATAKADSQVAASAANVAAAAQRIAARYAAAAATATKAARKAKALWAFKPTKARAVAAAAAAKRAAAALVLAVKGSKAANVAEYKKRTLVKAASQRAAVAAAYAKQAAAAGVTAKASQQLAASAVMAAATAQLAAARQAAAQHNR